MYKPVHRYSLCTSNQLTDTIYVQYYIQIQLMYNPVYWCSSYKDKIDMVHVHCTNQFIDPFCPVYGYGTKKMLLKQMLPSSNKKSVLFLSWRI